MVESLLEATVTPQHLIGLALEKLGNEFGRN
jgi:hypothetical protein